MAPELIEFIPLWMLAQDVLVDDLFAILHYQSTERTLETSVIGTDVTGVGRVYVVHDVLSSLVIRNFLDVFFPGEENFLGVLS